MAGRSSVRLAKSLRVAFASKISCSSCAWFWTFRWCDMQNRWVFCMWKLYPETPRCCWIRSEILHVVWLKDSHSKMHHVLQAKIVKSNYIHDIQRRKVCRGSPTAGHLLKHVLWEKVCFLVVFSLPAYSGIGWCSWCEDKERAQTEATIIKNTGEKRTANYIADFGWSQYHMVEDKYWNYRWNCHHGVFK